LETQGFDINSTNACKGLALILLLWHHLFYSHPEYGIATCKMGILAKVCVAIFVILSGYGFSESIRNKSIGLLEFYKNRLLVIYSNYWFIALIFVPIGVFFMNRTFQDAFNGHVYLKFLIQLTGLHRFFFSEYGYNATWWYLSVIVPLIILFPFMYDLIDKYGYLFLVFCCFILINHKFVVFPVINVWLFPFALGIYCSQRNILPVLSGILRKIGGWRFVVLIVAISLTALLRPDNEVRLDGVFGGLIILFVFEVSNAIAILKNLLNFLGKHLFNVFLFHTFVYYYFWKDFFYSFKSPLIIFFILLSSCILLSMLIEQIKKISCFYKLIDYIKSLEIPSEIEIPFRQGSFSSVCRSNI